MEQGTVRDVVDEQSTKACSFCGETILAVARKCRYCGEFLSSDETASLPSAGNAAPSEELASAEAPAHRGKRWKLIGLAGLIGAVLAVAVSAWWSGRQPDLSTSEGAARALIAAMNAGDLDGLKRIVSVLRPETGADFIAGEVAECRRLKSEPAKWDDRTPSGRIASAIDAIFRGDDCDQIESSFRRVLDAIHASSGLEVVGGKGKKFEVFTPPAASGWPGREWPGTDLLLIEETDGKPRLLTNVARIGCFLPHTAYWYVRRERHASPNKVPSIPCEGMIGLLMEAQVDP